MNRVPAKIGERFERLIVIEDLGSIKLNGNSKFKTYVKCLCDCGNVIKTAYYNVKNGNSKSCGCLNLEKSTERATTHGYAGKNKRHPLYVVHDNMHARTGNPNNTGYDRYGGRGIRVCSEWRRFEDFRDWAEANGWRRGLQLDRKNNNGNYEPDNCRFVTSLKNNRNRSTSKIWIIFGAEFETLNDAADSLGIPSTTICRWCSGYSVGASKYPAKAGCYSIRKYQNNGKRRDI